MVIIELQDGTRVSIEGYQVACQYPAVKSCVEAFVPDLGASGSDPNPDLTLANEVIKHLGGRIVRADETEDVPGRVY